MAKDASRYLVHMLEAIDNVAADTAGLDFGAFVADRRTRQLVERNLEIISEASRRVPETLRMTEPDIDWPAIAGIGNIPRHDYYRRPPEILWQTCCKDLLPLREALVRMLARSRPVP